MVCFDLADMLKRQSTGNAFQNKISQLSRLPGAQPLIKNLGSNKGSFVQRLGDVLLKDDWAGTVIQKFADFINHPQLEQLARIFASEDRNTLNLSVAKANKFLPRDLSPEKIDIRVTLSQKPEGETRGRVIRLNARWLLGLTSKTISGIIAHELIHVGLRDYLGNKGATRYRLSNLLEEGWAMNPQISRNRGLPGNHAADWRKYIKKLPQCLRQLAPELGAKASRSKDPFITTEWLKSVPQSKSGAANIVSRFSGKPVERGWLLPRGYAVGWGLMAFAYDHFDKDILKLLRTVRQSPREIWNKCSEDLLSGQVPPVPTGRSEL